MTMSETSVFTYQTRLTDPAAEMVLADYAALYGQVERSLFAEMAKGKSAGEMKAKFIRRFGITARQFNAVSIGLKGKIASIQRRRPALMDDAKSRIDKARKVIAKLSVRAPGSNKLHQKKRRLATLLARLARQEQDQQTGKVRLCFGSKRLFRAQFALSANGYADHAAWQVDWQAARADEFFVIGSKDETGGCQGCVATLQDDGRWVLRLRLPDALATQGKYCTLAPIRFTYGHEALLAARQAGIALSYRFRRDEKGWRVFVSVAEIPAKQISHRALGAVGVDINADHLAVSQTDRFGNLASTQRLPLSCYGKSAAQAKALIGDAAAAVIAAAKAARRPVVIEKLSFGKKRAALEAVAPAQARMLSSFAYTKVIDALKAAAFRAGIEVIEINPAYTSVIGAVNFAQSHGISVHQGAALAIARRGLGLSEKPVNRPVVTPVRNGGHVTFELPVRNRLKHVWTQWAAIRIRLKAAHVAHYRCGGARLPPPPLPLATRALGADRSSPARLRGANRSQHCSESVLADVPY